MTRPPLGAVALAAALHLAACAGAAAPSSLPPGAAAPAPGAEGASAVADAYVRAFFDRHPELGTVFTYPGTDHARLTDNALDAQRAWETEQDRFLERARALPRGAPGSQAWISRGILVDALEASVAYRACRPELWNVSSFSGWQSRGAQLATLQPVGTPELRDAAVKRLQAVGHYVDVEVANLREGLRLGFSSPATTWSARSASSTRSPRRRPPNRPTSPRPSATPTRPFARAWCGPSPRV